MIGKCSTSNSGIWNILKHPFCISAVHPIYQMATQQKTRNQQDNPKNQGPELKKRVPLRVRCSAQQESYGVANRSLSQSELLLKPEKRPILDA